MSINLLNKWRLQYVPRLPKILENPGTIVWQDSEYRPPLNSEIPRLFPRISKFSPVIPQLSNANDHDFLRVGVVLSGGQAPGGHHQWRWPWCAGGGLDQRNSPGTGCFGA